MTSIKTLKITDLKPDDISQMWGIFNKYYAGSTRDIFESDLNDKTYIFLLRDRLRDSIVGFSTIKEFSIEGVKGRFLFSGDTIVEQDYWGKNSLGSEFAKFLFSEKMKKPSVPLYWNLISKGYKTYLLLANNFVDYYPNPYSETPEKFKRLIDACGNYLYNGHYKSDKGLIQFHDIAGKDKLKEGICEINQELLAKNKKIRFFQEVNPNWRNGDELVCIGEFTFDLAFKKLFKELNKFSERVSFKKVVGFRG